MPAACADERYKFDLDSIDVGVIGTPHSWPSQATDSRGVMDAKKTEDEKGGGIKSYL
jgi:hypothetical protein